MANNTSYLEKVGLQWRVTVKVPRHLRDIVGKAHLRHPLHTDSLALANAKKHAVVHQLKGQLRAAEEQHAAASQGGSSARNREAMEWRADLQQAEDADREDFEGDHKDRLTSFLADRADEIAQAEGMEKAKEFHAIASGRATPITTLIDQWLAERPMKPRQQTDYKRAVTRLTDWLAARKHPEAIERVSRRVAGTYVSEVFVRAGVHPKTANKAISAIASLWKWAARKGFTQENIWSGQSLAKPQTTKAEEPRPFTDEEIKTLFSGKVVALSANRKPKLVEPSRLLRDFMSIAALSGMRVEEIARLTVKDIATLPAPEGTDQKPLTYFDITKAKTKAGERAVPIHSALTEIIARRTTDKEPTDSLWPELPEPKPGSPIEKSQKVVKEFVTYRRRVEVDDREEGARQSRITFHSWRRTFVTKAEQAGQPPHWIEVVVGHKRAGMTLGRYSGGPLAGQLQPVVESVRLPGSLKGLSETEEVPAVVA